MCEGLKGCGVSDVTARGAFIKKKAVANDGNHVVCGHVFGLATAWGDTMFFQDDKRKDKATCVSGERLTSIEN